MRRSQRTHQSRATSPWRSTAIASLTIRLAILAVGFANGVALMTAIPIFNEEARIDDPWGDWRRVEPRTLYDPPAYWQTAGVGYLGAAAEGQDPALSGRARDLFRASLDRAPGDAVTWSLLAWSEAFLADEDAAFRAQAQSWALAPHNLNLAFQRLAYIAGFADRPAARLPDGVRRDVALIYNYPGHRQTLIGLAGDVGAIATIIAELEAAEVDNADDGDADAGPSP